MPSTIPRVAQERFKPDKWHWYVVDYRDWYNPKLIRKHFDNERQAKEFITINFVDNRFGVLDGPDVMKIGVPHEYKYVQGETLGLRPKFKYPVKCVTQYQKQIYRNKIRRQMKKQEGAPKVTKDVVRKVIEDMPMLFMKRLKKWRNYHWAYSSPLKETKYWMGVFDDMRMVVKLTNITRCLIKHYDMGPYPPYQVAEKLYSMYQEWVDKWLKSDPLYGPRLSRVEAEFIARGFKPIFEVNPSEEDNYVHSIHLGQIYVHPTMCWHSYDEKKEFPFYIYDFQSMVGIPGYTGAHVAGLAKRK